MSFPTTPTERAARLAALRERKIASSAHAFVRATAPLFYEALASAKIPVGPDLWISGDCHGENVGAVPDAKGHVVFAMNDFDETAVANPTFDVLRMALSLAVALRGAGHSGPIVLSALAAIVEGYASGLETKRDVEPQADRLRAMIAHAQKMERRDLLERLCGDDHPHTLPHGEKFWTLSDALRAELAELVERPEVRAVIALSGDVENDASIEVHDVAFRVAGTSSLGAFRAALLVEIDDKTCAKRDRLRILDVKEVMPTSTPHGKSTPRDDVERITLGTKALAPSYAARRCAVVVHGKHALLRELMPQEAKASVDALPIDEVEPVARAMGRMIGRAHGRQLEEKDASAWRKEIVAKPEPLRAALAALVAAHEGEYLRVCGEGLEAKK